MQTSACCHHCSYVHARGLKHQAEVQNFTPHSCQRVRIPSSNGSSSCLSLLTWHRLSASIYEGEHGGVLGFVSNIQSACKTSGA